MPSQEGRSDPPPRILDFGTTENPATTPAFAEVRPMLKTAAPGRTEPDALRRRCRRPSASWSSHSRCCSRSGFGQPRSNLFCLPADRLRISHIVLVRLDVRLDELR